MNKLYSFVVLALAVPALLFASGQGGIDRRFGVENALSLSAFCKPDRENDQAIRAECGEPSVCANLATGNTFAGTNLIPPFINWREMIWERCRLEKF